MEKLNLEERERVQNALENPIWDFRTIQGISKETGLAETRVTEILENDLQISRKSLSPDKAGRALFTSRAKPIRLRECLAILQRAIQRGTF